MRQVLPVSAGVNEFQYATEMSAGWCAVTHTKEQISFALAYDPAVLPSCWLFSSYGGWRNLNTVILEPCTGYPISVSEGVKQGTHQLLQPGQSVECDIVASVFEGVSSVENVDRDGNLLD
jgi:hypothetical protein